MTTRLCQLGSDSQLSSLREILSGSGKNIWRMFCSSWIIIVSFSSFKSGVFHFLPVSKFCCSFEQSFFDMIKNQNWYQACTKFDISGTQSEFVSEFSSSFELVYILGWFITWKICTTQFRLHQRIHKSIQHDFASRLWSLPIHTDIQ